jgi:hypothetical protein
VEYETKKAEEKHTFVFRFDEDKHVDALRQVGKMAADPEIPFSWYDAAVVGQQIRNNYWELQKQPATPVDLSGTSFSRRS